MGLSWLACDLVTGAVTAELRDVRAQTLQRIVGAYSTTTVTLLARSLTQGWEGATQPGRSMLAAVADDGRVLWGGYVNRRRRIPGSVDLDLVTCEGYLDRRFVRDHTWTGEDQTSVIAAGLLADAAVTAGIGLVVDAPASGTLRDRTYKAADDATVYSRLTELMGVDGGPEFTIDLDWSSPAQTTLVKTARVRNRIGTASDRPEGVFEHDASKGGGLDAWEYVEDYSNGSGATNVLARSTSTGTDSLTGTASSPAAIAAGWPVFEYRYTPSDSITKASTLNAHAKAARDVMVYGTNSLSATAHLDRAPLLGREWHLGDDIAYRVVDRHITVEGLGRCIGFELDPNAFTVSPILAGPADDQGA